MEHAASCPYPAAQASPLRMDVPDNVQSLQWKQFDPDHVHHYATEFAEHFTNLKETKKDSFAHTIFRQINNGNRGNAFVDIPYLESLAKTNVCPESAGSSIICDVHWATTEV